MKWIGSHLLLVLLAGILFPAVPIKAQTDNNLFEFWSYYSDIENSQYKISCQLAFDQLTKRKSDISKINNPDQLKSHQQTTREKLLKLMGPTPEKTPLNAKVMGVIKKEDFLVEKILLESMPNYFVTAALFLPKKRKGKLPAIIYASGHTENGFRSPVYQRVIINLVKKGFAVLAFDPVGQGERSQYFDPELGKSRFGSTTIEHSYPGAQCYVSGYSPTRYFVWDGIRCVDYLLSRKEIDPQRIGMTGRSGGGTQTAFTAAVDQRILAAAPECFITNMEYVMKSIGPQDAEQNLIHMLKEGLDHADLLEVRAPKPGLIIATTRDFFSIQGAQDTYQEVKEYYRILEAGENISMVQDDAEHASTKKNREAMYAFFQKHLKNPGGSEDIDVDIFSDEELWVTAGGNVITGTNSETIYSLNRYQVELQKDLLDSIRSINRNASDVISSVKDISGFNYPKEAGKAVFSGRHNYDSYSLETYLISVSDDYPLPAFLLAPLEKHNGKLVLVLDESGVENSLKNNSVRSLLNDGYLVLTADVPGIGKLGPGYLKGDAYIDNTSFNQWFAGNITGKSIVAIRAEAIIQLINFATTDLEGINNIAALSIGALGSELLHASVFDPRIERVGMIKPFLSYTEFGLTSEYKPSLIPSVVAGAIEQYDLEDLMAVLNPRNLMILNPQNVMGAQLDSSQLTESINYPRNLYSNKGHANKFTAITGMTDSEIENQVLRWLK